MPKKIPLAEVKCMDPENYKKYFRALCWSSTSNRKYEKRIRKKVKKDKQRKAKVFTAVAVCHAPTLIGNPSQFAVYANVRKIVLTRWKYLNGPLSDGSDDSDPDDNPNVLYRISKITGIGLRAVFALVSQARHSNPRFCEQALKALLDVVQGHPPEDLAYESIEIVNSLQAMLVDIASGNSPNGRSDTPTILTSLSSSCLLALAVARGESEFILNTVASLMITAPTLAEQHVQLPLNMTTLQRSVQAALLGAPARNQWLYYGVPLLSLIMSFPVELPPEFTVGPGELVVRSLVSDGSYLYIFTSRGLIKLGSGYGSTVKQYVYIHKANFFVGDRYGWLGFCKNKLYVRMGRKKTDIYEVDKDTLETKHTLRLDIGEMDPVEPKSAVYTDGNQIGLILLNDLDNLTIKMYDVDRNDRQERDPVILNARKELKVHLLRRRTLAFGRAPFEDFARRPIECDAPIAMQLEDNDEDPLTGICAGQDFGLLLTSMGKVYYTGKPASLGYKVAAPNMGRWTLMKETLLRNDVAKRGKVLQVAVGHEGVHAILVLDNGSVMFTGLARRGEDGDVNKHRRNPKTTRPKKISKVDGYYIGYAACNYGSTALVTSEGQVLMFGKDTQHCDVNGLVTGLTKEKVTKIALGKAHAVALTAAGQVFTFGINNKGQCGREFGYTKEKLVGSRRVHKEELRLCVGAHSWATGSCRVCVMCRQCTGFYGACLFANLPTRTPGERCGCSDGDSGCTVCGICRRCAETSSSGRRTVDEDNSVRNDSDEKESVKYINYEGHSSGSEMEKDTSHKVSCLPPARIAVPGGHKITAIACGLHHTVLLTEDGEVLTFGSNQYGALGAGDIATHHKIVRVRVPLAAAIAAGSNHTAVLTQDGELYTFGCYQKGSLGRPRVEETRSERCSVWYATPGRVPRLGPRYACKAVWVSACGDQTFVQVSQALIKTDTLFSSTITANSNCIIILPNKAEHGFKCITICKIDGSCRTWNGPDQVNFVNTVACLDPLYDILWSYQPQLRIMRCYNIIAYDSHKYQRCCDNNHHRRLSDDDEYPNFGNMKRLDEFKSYQHFEAVCNNDVRPEESVALSNMSVLNPELAIPCVPGCYVSRLHAALHLLGCLDSLTYAYDNKPLHMECKRERPTSPAAPVMDDYYTVNRFESHGGGWGYSGHSVEAIRFMCDTDIMLGGYGLFGGRGDYTAKIKLYDIGPDGGDQETEGELIAESDEVVYECAPRDKFPVLFEVPVPLIANRWYVAWACINGPSSDCGSSGQGIILNDDVSFHFKTSKKSNNGTDVNAGQIPCLLYNIVSPDHPILIRNFDLGEPVMVLSRNLSRKITVSCIACLFRLLFWSWNSFKEKLLDTNGLVPNLYPKFVVMKHQKRLVYVLRACLRIVKCYVNELQPLCGKKRRFFYEFIQFLDIFAYIHHLIQNILADQTPTCSNMSALNKTDREKKSKQCTVQFALDMSQSVLKEAHETMRSCFNLFFPSPILKWCHISNLLYHTQNGVVHPTQIRELTAVCMALCEAKNLKMVLQYIVPMTQCMLVIDDPARADIEFLKELSRPPPNCPRSSHAQRAPPPPPSTATVDLSYRMGDPFWEWHLFDLIPRLLDVVVNPVKHHMMSLSCAPSHDHGEMLQQDQLSEWCCKLLVRIIEELAFTANNLKDDLESSEVKYHMLPSRYMRVSSNRNWTSSIDSPDAICFTVDRPGIVLVGIYMYGGPGTYKYTIELLHELRLRPTGVESIPSHCWVNAETINGTFVASDTNNDVVKVLFGRHLPIKEDVRYVLRVSFHGGRTLSGECGLTSVKGPDGTTFQFIPTSLSYSGTCVTRGQIPSLLYYQTTKNRDLCPESAERLIATQRSITLRVVSIILERAVDFFNSLRNELTTEDLRRNASILQKSHVINTLIPHTLAHLDGMDDSKSCIKILDMIRKLFPLVSAMNILLPGVEECPTNTTSHCYTWVESDHPYKQATVTNTRVLFPPTVSWIVLEFDPRSITGQPEDTLTVFTACGAPKKRCQCTKDGRPADLPFRKVYKKLVKLSADGATTVQDEAPVDAPCMKYNCSYVSVTSKLSNNPAEWPQKALLVPGNEVIFSLETATDYLKEYSKTNEESRYGYRCLCTGYEDMPFTRQRQGLAVLEMELAYAGASCAARLLSPELSVPSLTFPSMMELQVLAISGGNNGESVWSADQNEAVMLARGLDLPSPPTVYHVLDGNPLLRSVSTERQFLADFVAGAENTAGGRLAHWLAPMSRVEPAKCELKAPRAPVRPTVKTLLPIIVKDQYGDTVVSPALRVELIIQRFEDMQKPSHPTMPDKAEKHPYPDVPYHPTMRDTMCFHSITVMKAYQNYSFEELRLGARTEETFASSDYMPVERVLVQPRPDGSFVAAWVPRVAGNYTVRCTLDMQPLPSTVVVEVAECGAEEGAERFAGEAGAGARRLWFAARSTCGLRVRAAPSLQAEELGRLPPAATLAYVEEVTNKDGTWVRLSDDSAQTYAECAGAAWCLQYHRHFEVSLLVPVSPTSSPLYGFEYEEDKHANCDSRCESRHESYINEDDEGSANDSTDAEDCFPFTIRCDLNTESDSSTSPYHDGNNGRRLRNDPRSIPTPRRIRRNGNDFDTPDRGRMSDNFFDEDDDDILETDILEVEVDVDEEGPSRLAQACTQTSPDNEDFNGASSSKEAQIMRASVGTGVGPIPVRRVRSTRRSPPPLPARTSAPPPRKHALSPTQAECLRAVFAALLWHEGIVHDAIACAAFLKFHPQLPRAGERVVTRAPHDAPPSRPLRHSVEVSNAGQYLQIHPSTLETLTRSGTEASSSRARKTDISTTIREEDAQPGTSDLSGQSQSVVNVLPPALRALVALWDALYDAKELTVATDRFSGNKGKIRRGDSDTSSFGGPRRKRSEWRNELPVFKTPFSVSCEACGRCVPPPLVAHLRDTHPGCGAPSAHGYDRAGNYRPADTPHHRCGYIAAGYQLWYMFCEKCHDKALKLAAPPKLKLKSHSESMERIRALDLDHIMLRNNAVFLLDLAPLTNSESMESRSDWSGEQSGRSPPTPLGSAWLPAPSFQCLPALGAVPRLDADTARYHSLGRPPPPTGGGAGESGEGREWRVHRSVSMGQAGARDLAFAARPPPRRDPHPEDSAAGAGSSLLSQPSAALQKLVGCGEWTSDGCGVSAFENPKFDIDVLMQSPVLAFILAKRDLHTHRQKMDATVRINTIRQYAFEALNWLLRSTTQAMCAHDVMWWFCNALDKFARFITPPVTPDDNKENTAVLDTKRSLFPTAYASAICPGGRAARGALAAFHAFLGSVSSLAPSLPPTSAASLQAVRSWALHYSQQDRAFLHRSQVFNVISKILSHAEDGVYDDGLLGALQESYHSHGQQNFVWNCIDVTEWCEITVSSRQGLAGTLTDGSTETFWESGDEDRNKAKWIQVCYPSGTSKDRPHVICIHIDNTRDTSFKTLLVSFLYSGGASEMYHMQDIDVNPKAASWICYTLPRVSGGCARVRCELRGPDAAVRVRGARVLSVPAPTHPPLATDRPRRAPHPLHSLAERDTLRVFRLLTTQVFGKLLDWEQNASDSGESSAVAIPDTVGDDSDLCEHVVGILFAGNNLTSLQRQVMSHIVIAIGGEAARVRDDWETALLCAEAGLAAYPGPARAALAQDSYCFEMLSLLLALSGSSIGRIHLAQRTELLNDLLALLHTGSERVQRQVISLLRRIVIEIAPQKMLAALNYGTDMEARVSFLDNLLCYLGKAITVQVKVKGGGAAPASPITMGPSVTADSAPWFMRGITPKKHAHLVAKFISDMAEDKISALWGVEARTVLARYAIGIAQAEEADRTPERCVASPAMWMTLAALCVCEDDYINLVNPTGEASRASEDEAQARRFCANHDDALTTAVIECRTCGPLCAECDRFLHLNRVTRTHHRQICKEEESAIRIDIHEGCGRAKLFWLLLLVDRRTLKGLAEFRSVEPGLSAGTSAPATATTLCGVCRFCGLRGNSGLLAIGNICADQQCQEYGKEACLRVLLCGHSCGGVRGERTCLPCLHGCGAGPLRQDADDMCMICFTDPLQAAPALQLRCGHVFHLHCCKKVLINKWNGPRITFSFSQCPICKDDMDHWTLEELLTPIRNLREEVKRKALMRLEYEGNAAGETSHERTPLEAANYAMEKFAYYVCHKCGKAYFGGNARCEAECAGAWQPGELACGACSDVTGARSCPKHGTDFLEYKCRFCCSVAVFFCFGTSHFCNACHDDFQRVTNIPRHLLPQCPAGPKGEQLPGTSEECPLHIQHPPTGEEFALGCGVCRHAQAF